jgi:Zn ribbon nucleic-acid-binding protein
MFRKSNEGVNFNQKQILKDTWHNESGNAGVNHKIRKQFINCKCPKCDSHHDVYMLWTGRGIPRKYCITCKNMVSGYDEAVFFETSAASQRYRAKKVSNHAVD